MSLLAPGQVVGPRGLGISSSHCFPQSVFSLVGHDVEIEYPLEEILTHLQHRLLFGILKGDYPDRQVTWITVRAQKCMLCKASMLFTDSSRFLTALVSPSTSTKITSSRIINIVPKSRMERIKVHMGSTYLYSELTYKIQTANVMLTFCIRSPTTWMKATQTFSCC